MRLFAVLELSNQAVEAKRERNVVMYNWYYQEARELYDYIGNYIYSLNNKRFKINSDNYDVLSFSLRYLGVVSSVTLIIVAISNTLLIILLTKSITNPLKSLVDAANQIGEGNFSVELLETKSKDEIGVVSNAFNKMVISIRSYIDKITENMETERALKEKELMMENHLKDANRTYEYVQKVAELFRYNIKKSKICVKSIGNVTEKENFNIVKVL